jgi:hypothetical protein
MSTEYIAFLIGILLNVFAFFLSRNGTKKIFKPRTRTFREMQR